MTRPRMVSAALTCAALLLVPASAGAATTVRGTVVGAPVTTNGAASVPILLSEASRRALRASDPVVRVRVPAARGVRARTGVLKPGGLRIGDRVRVAVGRVRSGTVRGTVLRVTARGGVASFDRLAATRATATTRARAAADAVAKLDATGSGVQGATATTPGALRDELLALRRELNFLIADLLAISGQMTDAVARIERERPAAPARREATARRQAPLIAALTASRDETDAARVKLEEAVTRLDRAILDVGGVSAPDVPIGTVGTVSDVVQTVLFLLGELELPSAR